MSTLGKVNCFWRAVCNCKEISPFELIQIWQNWLINYEGDYHITIYYGLLLWVGNGINNNGLWNDRCMKLQAVSLAVQLVYCNKPFYDLVLLANSNKLQTRKSFIFVFLVFWINQRIPLIYSVCWSWIWIDFIKWWHGKVYLVRAPC